ncbi:MAG: hypothetical protein ACYCY9_01295 [Thiobacillus sp.]
MRIAFCLLALLCAPAMAAAPILIMTRPRSELAVYPVRAALAMQIRPALRRGITRRRRSTPAA